MYSIKVLWDQLELEHESKLFRQTIFHNEYL